MLKTENLTESPSYMFLRQIFVCSKCISLPYSIRQPGVCNKEQATYIFIVNALCVCMCGPRRRNRVSDRNFNVMWSDFRRHGSQCACYYGPRRTKKADREHEVPSFNGALASIQKYCRVSTVPTLLFIPLYPFQTTQQPSTYTTLNRLNIPKVIKKCLITKGARGVFHRKLCVCECLRNN